MTSLQVKQEPASQALPKGATNPANPTSGGGAGGAAASKEARVSFGNDAKKQQLKGSTGKADESSSSAGKGSGSKAASTNSADITQDANFDIYSFLNDNKERAMLRDPVLQQMSVVKYEGEVDSTTGFFHGKGRLVSTLGYTYTGAFDKGMMHGEAKLVWNDGTTYEGHLDNNIINGFGKYTWPNGDTYQGELSQFVRHGQGTFFYRAMHATYEGEWNNGMRYGKGTLKYNSSGACMYRGEWVNDARTGKGVMVYDNNVGVYDGEWKSNERHGSGSMTWKRDGVVVEEFKGQWSHGIPNGVGTSTYIRPPPPTPPSAQQAGTTLSPDSMFGGGGGTSAIQIRDSAINTYSGEYSNGMRNGHGTFIYDDGSKYEGQWVDNQKHGEGKYIAANGVVFVGQFENGTPVTSMTDNKPETTVASPIPLFIRDLLGEGENNVQESIIAVQSIISRNHGLLRKLFSHYSAMEVGVELVGTPSNWKKTRTLGTISLIQFFRICSDAKIVNKHVSVAQIDRLLLAFRDRNTSTSSSVYFTGEDNGGGAAVSQPLLLQQHSPTAAPLTSIGSGVGGSYNEKKDSTATGGAAAAAAMPAGGSGSATASGATSTAGAATNPSPVQQQAPQQQTRHSSNAKSSTSSMTAAHHRDSGSSHSARSFARGGSGQDLGPFVCPWDKYRSELHLFQGELNYREFVEALVRIARFMFNDPIYGTLAQCFQTLVNEYLSPYTCSPAHAAPLCPLTREHKALVVPAFIEPLRTCYYNYCSATSLEMGGTTTLPKPGQDVALTVRQFALFLKNSGAMDPDRLSMNTIYRLVPYEKHALISATVYRKQFMTMPQNANQLGMPSAGGGPGTSTTGSILPASASFTINPPPGSATGERGAAGQQQPFTPNATITSQSGSDRISVSGSMMGEPETPRFNEGMESLYQGKVEMERRGKGFQNSNLHATLVMEMELTFAEFVEALLKAGLARCSEATGTQSQRIQTFMETYVVPTSQRMIPLQK